MTDHYGEALDNEWDLEDLMESSDCLEHTFDMISDEQYRKEMLGEDNCVDLCAFADDNLECDGQCATRPKLETLDQVDIDCASHSLIMEGDK